jgi:putative ABC transport system permease protein
MTQLRHAVRRLLRAKGFTIATILTLAIGIGATTAIFSVVNGVLLKPLPFPDSERLIALRHGTRLDDAEHDASGAFYVTYRDNNRTFESVALWVANAATVTGAGDPEEIRAVRATYEFLPTLGVSPAMGRGFTAEDDQPGSPPTVMLSHGYWQRIFGGAEDAVGRTLTIDGAPHEVIGVLPAAFRFLEQPADILAPHRVIRATEFVPSFGPRGIARLKDGMTLADASADATRMLPIMLATFPTVPGLTPESLELVPLFKPLKQRVVGDLGDVLWLLMGTIGALLLIACANVANLQLVRTEGRAQELAIRSALGAGWAAIARSVLLESILLGVAGGALGLALAFAALPALLSVARDQLPAALDVSMDATVLWFTLAVSLACGALFALLPIVKYARPRVAAALHGAARAYSTTRDRHRARNALVVAQVALALILLTASGLMIRTFQALRDVDPGVSDPDRVQTLRVSIPPAAVPEFPRVIAMLNDIENRLAATPGVESVGFATRRPLEGRGPNGPFSVDGATDALSFETEFRYASPGYLRALGAPLIGGRGLEWADTFDGRQVVVVSASLAQAQFGSAEAALGKRLRRGPNAAPLEIVGVAADIRHDGVDQPAPNTVYLPQSEFLSQYASRTVFFFVRSNRVGTAGFTDGLARAIWAAYPELPLGSVQTLGEIYDASIARTSLTLLLLAITASMALLLGLVGIYGAISYMVAQRTREIGIRMALGAQNAALKRMLVSQVLLLVGVGVALGLGGAAALTRLMQSLLFGVTALDPATFVVVPIVLVVTALLAGYLPARRVTRIDPMHALRVE